MSDNKPKKKINVGNVQGTVWENEVEKDGVKFVKLSVSFEKRYKKGDEWKSTNSYDKHELVKLRLAVDEAIKECFLKDEE